MNKREIAKRMKYDQYIISGGEKTLDKKNEAHWKKTQGHKSTKQLLKENPF